MAIYIRNANAVMKKLNCTAETAQLLQERVAEAQHLLDTVGITDELIIRGKLELEVEVVSYPNVHFVTFRKFQNGWWIQDYRVRSSTRDSTDESYIAVPVALRSEVSERCLRTGWRASYLGFYLVGSKVTSTVAEGRSRLRRQFTDDMNF